MESRQLISEDNTTIITGVLRVNPKNYKESYINDPDGGRDICIIGLDARGAALDGDLVKISLNHDEQWLIDVDKIANKWYEYERELLYEVQQIKEKLDRTQMYIDESTGKVYAKDVNLKNSTARTKSDVKSKDKDSNGKRRLPSNLPIEICQLKYECIRGKSFTHEVTIKTGKVKEIMKRNHNGFAGGYLAGKFNEHSVLFKPTDHRVPRMLIPNHQLPKDYLNAPGRYKETLFVARILSWTGANDYANGELVKIIGQGNSLESQMEALLIEHQIYDHEFPPDVQNELAYLHSLPDNWFEANSQGRRDLTNECVLTVDPKTARDLDDALHIKQVSEQIYEVGVHIADVSYFVKEMSAVDYHARLRTTSVYLVDRVIPMLPRILCERVCSLNPGESKFTFSVIWKLDRYGRIIDEWMGRTIIRTSAKLAYEQAQDIIDRSGSTDWIIEGNNMPNLYSHDWKTVSRSIVLLNKIAQNMRAKRFNDGALRIDQTKIKFELDRESGVPTGFSFEKRTSANYMIEEFMLLANMSVAKRIFKFNKELAFLRRHPPSSPRLLVEVKEFCQAKGIELDIESAGGIQKSINSISNPTMSKVVSFLLLRSMQPAEYICTGALPANDPYGFHHFALNAPFYTHFTSPIRRYPDVIVHRMLAMALDYGESSQEESESLRMMADLCTRRKISAKHISDVSQKWYFNLFVLNAGYCELLACVTKIFDMSFDVILIDYDRTGRVYLDRLKPNLIYYEYQSCHGIKSLILNWKSHGLNSLTRSGRRNRRRKIKKANNFLKNTEGQIDSRTSLEAGQSGPNSEFESQVIEADSDGIQTIEVFDIVRVIVTADKSDVTTLKIDLKVPEGQKQPTLLKK